MLWQDKIAPEGVACQMGREWLLTQPDPLTAYQRCADGSFLHWALTRLGVKLPAAITYRAATRALAYASDELDAAGVAHGLRGRVVDSQESARDAAIATRDADEAEGAEVVEASNYAARVAEVAEWVDAEWIEPAELVEATEVAALAAGEHRSKELAAQADDIRELIPESVVIEALKKAGVL